MQSRNRTTQRLSLEECYVGGRKNLKPSRPEKYEQRCSCQGMVEKHQGNCYNKLQIVSQKGTGFRKKYRFNLKTDGGHRVGGGKTGVDKYRVTVI